ncbi:hypothetical protein NDU88_002251 [Pleurodeles waltl]|uniref:Uncharacterized protein n=1 Tax=Pleurodeles waltl TaxID=8319 RepID=A0AAV7VA20_PLEWA|nr:hypothetical protein NDU88_002251 [Pleurodeles waltl]
MPVRGLESTDIAECRGFHATPTDDCARLCSVPRLRVTSLYARNTIKPCLWSEEFVCQPVFTVDEEDEQRRLGRSVTMWVKMPVRGLESTDIAECRGFHAMPTDDCARLCSVPRLRVTSLYARNTIKPCLWSEELVCQPVFTPTLCSKILSTT